MRLICWFCCADPDGTNDAYDSSQSAGWRGSLITMAKFWTDKNQGCLSQIWKIIGMRIGDIRPDWMHTVDLGILQDVQGNTLWYLFKTRLKGSYKRWPKTCGQFKNMMKNATADMGVQRPFNNLTLGMIRGKPRINRNSSRRQQ